MSTSDLIGSVGVSVLLIAFLLNLRGELKTDQKTYAGLNIFGAVLCGISAYLIRFYPFVILEGVWAIAALSSRIKRVPRETLNN